MKASRQRDLAVYYDAEAEARVRSDLSERRVALHEQDVELFRREGAQTIVGAGSGLDVRRFRSEGFDVVGLDLSERNVALLTSIGVRAVVGSVVELPLPSHTFDVVWTMSTLVHISDEEVHVALGELCRVCRPGGLVAVGSWGSRDWEGTSDFTRFDPPRFFSLRDHARWRRILEDHGTIERYDTFVTTQDGWEYQFALLRT